MHLTGKKPGGHTEVIAPDQASRRIVRLTSKLMLPAVSYDQPTLDKLSHSCSMLQPPQVPGSAVKGGRISSAIKPV